MLTSSERKEMIEKIKQLPQKLESAVKGLTITNSTLQPGKVNGLFGRLPITLSMQISIVRPNETYSYGR